MNTREDKPTKGVVNTPGVVISTHFVVELSIAESKVNSGPFWDKNDEVEDTDTWAKFLAVRTESSASSNLNRRPTT